MSQAETPESPNPEAAPPEPPRSWWRFSLAGLFVLILLVALPMAWLASGPERQRRVVATLQEKGYGIHHALDQENPFAERKGWLPIDYYVEVSIVSWNGGRSDKTINDDLALVAQLPAVEQLLLQDSAVDDEGLAHLAGLRKVFLFQLHGTKVTDAGLAHLAEWDGLQYLLLRDTAVTDAGIQHLAGISSLEMLFLERTRVAGPGLKHLAGCGALQALDLGGCPIDDAGLAHLPDLPKLRSLNLARTKVTGKGLMALAKLRSLKTLGLADLPIEDADLSQIIPGILEELDLTGTRITPAAVKPLERLKLKKLVLAETAITPDDAARWEEAKLLGDCLIYWKRKPDE